MRSCRDCFHCRIRLPLDRRVRLPGRWFARRFCFAMETVTRCRKDLWNGRIYRGSLDNIMLGDGPLLMRRAARGCLDYER